MAFSIPLGNDLYPGISNRLELIFIYHTTLEVAYTSRNKSKAAGATGILAKSNDNPEAPYLHLPQGYFFRYSAYGLASCNLPSET